MVALEDQPLAPPTHLHLAPSPPVCWDALVSGSTDSLFARPAWVQAVRAGMGTEVLYAALLDEAARPVVGLVAWERRLPGLRMLHSFLPYGGPVGDRSRAGELFAVLLPELRRRGYHRLDVEDPSPEPVPGLPGTPVAGTRHVADLRGVATEEELLRSYPPPVRRAVRRARAAGVEVAPAGTGGDVETAYRLYLAAMERNRAPAWYPLSLFRALHERLSPHPVEFLVARLDGRAVAMLVLARSGRGTHYWMGGSVPEAFPARANDLLFHTALVASVARGDDYFDLMGTPPGDADLARFKHKWGGRPQTVLAYHVDLSSFRAGLWQLVRGMARSGPGASLLRRIRRTA